MARYYEITTTVWFTELEAAIKDYYGDGAVIHKSATDGVVFSCPQISDKYMRIRLYQPYTSYSHFAWQLYVASELNSDGTLTSAVTVGAYGSTNYTDYHRGAYIVLADEFLIAQTGASDNAYSSSILVAKCSNGRYMFVAGLGGTFTGSCMYSDTLTAAPIRFVGLSTYANFKSSGKMVLLPAYFANDFEMELNADGSFAYVNGLFVAPKRVTNEPIVGGNYYISVAPIRSSAADGIYSDTSFYVELES